MIWYIVVLAAAATDPHASIAEAEKDYRLGLELQAKGDWTAALAALQDAIRVLEAPGLETERERIVPAILYEVGLTAEHIDSEVAAMYDAFARYLERPPPDPRPEAIAHAHAAMEGAKNRVGRLSVRGPDAARISLDGRSIGELPLLRPVITTTGAHTLEAVDRTGRRSRAQQVEIAPDATLQIDLAEALAPPPSTARPDEARPDVAVGPSIEGPPPEGVAGSAAAPTIGPWTWVSGGGTVAAFAGGVALGVGAYASAKDGNLDAARGRATGADALMIAAAAGAIVTAVLVWLDLEQAP